MDDSHRDDYIRVTKSMRKMDTTHGGGEGSESVGDAFKPPQIVGKDSEERLKIQHTVRLSMCQLL